MYHVALLELADCARDYMHAIRGLRQSLDEHHSEETLEKLNKAESARNDLEAQERLHQANSVIEFHYIVKYIKFHTFEI